VEQELQPGPHRPVVRVGNTVRRRAEWWTPAVHHLLAYLDDAGFALAPKPLGIDDDGREVLSFIDGDSPRDNLRVASDDGLRAYARSLRAYHDAVANYRPAPGLEWAYGEMPLRDGDIMCHGDFGTWNLVWRGSDVVGILDWDLAYPGPALDDVAYALVYSVPFRSDEDASRWFAFDEPPNRPRRLEMFADAYGIDTDGLVDAVIARQEKYARQIRYLHDRGLDAPWVSTKSMQQNDDAVRWSRAHRALFTSR
jgi:Phosphotransferase enzyme family